MNRASWAWRQPTIIVLGAKTSTIKRACMMCTKPTPISADGLDSFRRLRSEHTAVLLLCHPCQQSLKLEDALGQGASMTTSTLREIKGFSR